MVLRKRSKSGRPLKSKPRRLLLSDAEPLFPAISSPSWCWHGRGVPLTKHMKQVDAIKRTSPGFDPPPHPRPLSTRLKITALWCVTEILRYHVYFGYERRERESVCVCVWVCVRVWHGEVRERQMRVRLVEWEWVWYCTDSKKRERERDWENARGYSG